MAVNLGGFESGGFPGKGKVGRKGFSRIIGVNKGFVSRGGWEKTLSLKKTEAERLNSREEREPILGVSKKKWREMVKNNLGWFRYK